MASKGKAGKAKRGAAEEDPEAIVFISEVHEAFGEGFGSITG